MAESILSQLEEEPGFDSPTRITLIADWVLANNPVDLKKLKCELTLKLKKFRYPPERDLDGETYYEWLCDKRAVRLILNSAVLTKLWNCLLLPEIHATDIALRKSGKSVQGLPLDFHRAMSEELIRHRKALESLMADYKVKQRWTRGYRATIKKQLDRELHAVVRSVYPRSRKALFEGHSSPKVGTQLAIYQVLRECLKGKDFSDRFFQYLSVLVFIDPSAEVLASVDNLRHAVERMDRGARKVRTEGIKK